MTTLAMALTNYIVIPYLFSLSYPWTYEILEAKDCFICLCLPSLVLYLLRGIAKYLLNEWKTQSINCGCLQVVIFYLFLFPFSYSKHFYEGNGLLLESDKKGFE